MLILAVTALRSNVVPAVLLNKSNRVANFHVIAPRSSGHNDEVERRGGALSANEADLSQSSISSLAHRSCAPRSREPIVRPTSRITKLVAQPFSPAEGAIAEFATAQLES
jgi:hypothetical protein